VGQRKEAHELFEKAIDLDPKSDEAYFQLGVILRREGKLEDAKQMFLKALHFHPDNPNVYNNLGTTLLEQQKFPEAIKALNKALEIYPEHINARYNLGLALWSMGKTEPALKEYRKILGVKPNWATAANSLAWILATDKNDEIRNGREAIRWALVACEGNGRKNPEYLDTLGAAYAQAGHFEEATRTAQKSLILARSEGDADLAEEVKKRLLLYKAEKAFTE
jgi:Flp pilus assembly protein TadD